MGDTRTDSGQFYPGGKVIPRQPSGGGGSGADGATFFPSVSDQGVISWTNNQGRENPPPKNIRGDNGTTPHVGENGNWWIGETDTGVAAQGPQGEQGEQGEQGQQGEQGADGTTPHVGENGHWWIGETDTGVMAQGPKGDDGDLRHADFSDMDPETTSLAEVIERLKGE